MNSRNLDLAAQFCELVNKPHLLEYLGLPEDASPDAAQKKLKARRKYMQGMQSNPKYKQEAMFLIKNFSGLNAVLMQPVDYLDDARRRTESQHIPVLRMTVQGVLAGGSLNHDQEDFLRRNALELGVSESTFEDLLDELCKEAGVGRANAELRISPREFETLDFYGILGIARHSSRDEIYARYRARKEECQNLTDPGQRESERMRLEKAWKVLGDAEARAKYDLSWTRTGPPARNRQSQSQAQATTAPPIKKRPDLSKPQPSLAPARLEILSARKQTIELKGSKVKVVVEVRNGGEQPLKGTVTASAPWLRVLTPELDPDVKQQPIRVEIDPAQVEEAPSAATLRISLEDGSFATVDFEVRRPNNLVPLIGGAIGVVLVLLLLAAGLFFMNRETTATLTIDPWAAEVLIDGVSVGRGGRIVLDNPPGTATVTIRHPNFKPWVKDVDLSAGSTVHAELELSSNMSFKPEPSMRRANLGQDVAGQTMSEFRPRLDRCLKLGRSDNEELKGTLRIHVSKAGTTNGFDLQGDGATSAEVLNCLKRQAAGPLFPSLKSGDFATIRYDYIISGP